MTVLAIVLQILLGLVFLAAGVTKLRGAPQHVEDFARWRYPAWFLPVTGAVEVLGALGMLVGTVVASLAVPAAILLAVDMTGALITHLRAGDPPPRFAPPSLLLSLALLVALLR